MDVSQKHIESLFHYISSRVVPIDNSTARSVIAVEKISTHSTELIAPFFEYVVLEAFRKQLSPEATVLAEALFLAVLNGIWPTELLVHTREAAAFYENEITLAFLLEPEPPDDDEDLAIPKYNLDRPLTLGERKTFATLPLRKNIEVAMADPHPDVALKLLDNPKLTENDVVRICAKALMSTSVLCEIAKHPKWRKRHMIKRALTNNKRVPTSFAVTLIPFLDSKSVIELSMDNRLPIATKDAAQLLIKKSKKVGNVL